MPSMHDPWEDSPRNTFGFLELLLPVVSTVAGGFFQSQAAGTQLKEARKSKEIDVKAQLEQQRIAGEQQATRAYTVTLPLIVLGGGGALLMLFLLARRRR